MSSADPLNNFVLSESFIKLFESTKGILFFIKDKDCKLITGNDLLVKHLGFSSKEEIKGKTDFEIFSQELAERYFEDDLEVIQSCKAKENIVEIFPNYLGVLSWFVTCKIPLFNTKGEIAGLCGILQSYDNSNSYARPLKEIAKALEYIKDNYMKKISNEFLADLCKLSVRQFENRFKEIFKVTPHQYLIKLKILKACDILLTDDSPIIDVALDLGFYDQSAFTAHFKKQIGITPHQYIKKHMK
ncbi:MAG: AraC family transcriptional regulator [Lentisphaeraceae bacterium]|nr:AraC family transcriptional regulator [Lentisphaeraceae bacterium]